MVDWCSLCSTWLQWESRAVFFHQLYNIWVASLLQWLLFLQNKSLQDLAFWLGDRKKKTYWTHYSRQPSESPVFHLPSPNFHTIHLYLCHFRLFSLLQESSQWFDHWGKSILHWLSKSILRVVFLFYLFNWKVFFPRWSSGSACILGQKCNLKAFDVKPKSDGCILIEACFYPNKYMLHCFTYYSVRFIRVQEIKSTCKKRRLTYPMLGLGKSPNF